jgi:hypothetical protein
MKRRNTMIFTTGNMTARDAAKQFAETFQEEPRKVGTVLNIAGCDPGKGIQFRLVGGLAWYTVRMLPDYSGWEVTKD